MGSLLLENTDNILLESLGNILLENTIMLQGLFANEIAHYLEDNSSGIFDIGEGDTNLKVGELERGRDGVFIVENLNQPPDPEIPLEYYQLDFMFVNTKSDLAFSQAQFVYDLFHQAHHYDTTSFKIHFSHSVGQIVDLDRDLEGRKLLRLSVLFIAMELIS